MISRYLINQNYSLTLLNCFSKDGNHFGLNTLQELHVLYQEEQSTVRKDRIFLFLFAVKGNYVINLASFFSGPPIEILLKLDGRKKKLKINTNLSEEREL